MPNPAFPNLDPGLLLPTSLHHLMLRCAPPASTQPAMLPPAHPPPPPGLPVSEGSIHDGAGQPRRCLADNPRLRCSAADIRRALEAHLISLLPLPPPQPAPGQGPAAMSHA